MNFGRPIGKIGKWAISRPGPWLALLAFAAAGLICFTTRIPVKEWSFSFVDLRYYANLHDWPSRLPEMTRIDFEYTVGLCLWILAAMLWSIRLIFRQLAIIIYRPLPRDRSRFGRYSVWVLLCLLIGFVGVGIGWPYRIAQRWTTNLPPNWLNPPPTSWGWPSRSPVDYRPLPMTPGQERHVLHSAIRHLSQRSHRLAAIQFLLQTSDHKGTPAILANALSHETDFTLKVVEIRLLGIYVDPEAGPLLARFLSDPQSEIREAAADALSMSRQGQPFQDGPLQYPLPTSMKAGETASISWDGLRNGISGHFSIPSSAREVLAKMMVAGASPNEREAAARALVDWHTDSYQLRYAEWGVFMADAGGRLKFVQAQLDEIPPFVHRVGNPGKEIGDRVNVGVSMPIWKPVIHLTADRPMAVDLEVCIAKGRPWVVYPGIDDLAIKLRSDVKVGDNSLYQRFPEVIRNEPSPLNQFDPVGLPHLSQLRGGYPWDRPSQGFAMVPPVSDYYNLLHFADGIGVRWQSIIVSPTKLDWMKPADVPNDARFAWWKRLREVDCSWIASRGESDRFLYYDGPTTRKSPVGLRMKSGRLVSFVLVEPTNPHRGAFIEVTNAGVACAWFDSIEEAVHLNISSLAIQPSEKAAADFARVIEEQGLSHQEAAGLVDCWKPAFFHTPGKRALVLMSAADYEAACPMQIRPQPTEKSRVGIIWTELAN